MRWYNEEHHHSGIKYVTPSERHSGQDVVILQRRRALYKDARRRCPERWSGGTRNWDHIEEVTLNGGRHHRIKEGQAASSSAM